MKILSLIWNRKITVFETEKYELVGALLYISLWHIQRSPGTVKDRSLQLILYCGANIQMICRAGCPHPAAEKPCWLLKRELVGAQPLHFACAKTFCHSNTPQGCLLLAQTRTCRGAAPPSCYRKTVLSLAHPTGVCIVELHSTNANFAFDDQNENRYRCACFHKRCVT